MARNDDQDPELERDLRGHFTSSGDDLRAPGDMWSRLEGRLGEQRDPFSLSKLGGKLIPQRGTFWNPAVAGGTVAAAALVATISVWSATDGFGGGGQPWENFEGSSENFVVVTREVEVMEREVTVVVAQPAELMEREVTRVVEMQAEVMERVITATPAPPRGVLGPRSERGPQGEQGLRGPRGRPGDQGPPDVLGAQGDRGSQGDLGPRGSRAPTAVPRPTSGPETLDPSPRDTTFADYRRQSFIDAQQDNVSTFSLDTDRTSYQLALNWAQNGYEIDPSSVRAEEWINAFDYNYDLPRSNREFAISSDVMRHPLDDDLHLARVSFQAPVVGDDAPLNVTLVLDASGSMADGNRVAIAREAAEAIRKSLGPSDRIAVVHFTNDVIDEYTISHSHPDSGGADWSIAQLAPHGSTNVQAGLDLGVRLADQARRERPDTHNYIILMSDGVANVDATDPFAILESAYDRDSGNPLRIIAIGVGIANYNDYLLEQIAQHGNGWYRYLQDEEQARSTFSKDNWLAISTPFADQARAQVTWDEDVVASWRIVGYENRITPDATFTQDRKEFAELPSGSATTVFYELELRRDVNLARFHDLGDIELRWLEPGSGESRQQRGDVSGRVDLSFGNVSDPLLAMGAIVALAADRYSSLDEGYSNPAWVSADLRVLDDLLWALEASLSGLQAFEDLWFLMGHMRSTLDYYEPAPTYPSGYSP